MSRYLILLFVLLIGAPFAQAEDLGPKHPLAPGEILRGHYVEYHLLKGSNKPVPTEGHFAVAPSQGLIWVMEHPAPFTFVVTSAGMGQFLGGVPIVYEPASKIKAMSNLTALVSAALSSNWAVLEKDFHVTRSGTPDHWHVKITPHKGGEGENLFVSLTAEGGVYVETADLIEIGGGSDHFTFSKLSISPAGPTDKERALFNNRGPQ